MEFKAVKIPTVFFIFFILDNLSTSAEAKMIYRFCCGLFMIEAMPSASQPAVHELNFHTAYLIKLQF